MVNNDILIGVSDVLENILQLLFNMPPKLPLISPMSSTPRMSLNRTPPKSVGHTKEPVTKKYC